KKEKSVDSSMTEFYFPKHRKNDQSWVGVVESTYDKFEQKKLKFFSQNLTISGEEEVDSQPTIGIPPDLDIWVESVKKKKEGLSGLETVYKTLVSLSNKLSSRKGRCKGKVVHASLFGVGATEALVIGVVALLVFGPKFLVEDKFERKKLEISSQNLTISEEREVDSQSTIEIPPDLDIWVESVKKKKEGLSGLETVYKTLVSLSNKLSSISSDSQEIDALRSQVHA
ncbi:hypothetical protein RYX36_013315, partial [Vicia faba]